MIGGLSIPYVTIPTNNSTGITIGGTKYFMVILLLENRFGLVNRATLQSAEDYSIAARIRQASNIIVRRYVRGGISPGASS